MTRAKLVLLALFAGCSPPITSRARQMSDLREFHSAWVPISQVVMTKFIVHCIPTDTPIVDTMEACEQHGGALGYWNYMNEPCVKVTKTPLAWIVHANGSTWDVDTNKELESWRCNLFDPRPVLVFAK